MVRPYFVLSPCIVIKRSVVEMIMEPNKGRIHPGAIVASSIPDQMIPVPHRMKDVGGPGSATYVSPFNGGLIYSKILIVVLMKEVQNINGLECL